MNETSVMGVNTERQLELIRRALQGPRPGRNAHLLMIPGFRRALALEQGWEPAYIPRHGAVLLLLYPRNGELYLVLTRRTHTVATHKGQVSLPGGAFESGDASYIQTALRETQEELGVPLAEVHVLGELTPLYIPPSQYQIHPVVGYSQTPPVFQMNTHEVAEILEITLEYLLSSNCRQEEDWELEGQRSPVPFFDVLGHKVWGATAMVLAEFVEMVNQATQSCGT
ncbi:MAG: CoA pyrophosphatase [Chloroflexi bacterium]|nr:CoA pyrophosphatase [Chloroflexota bacterium]